MGFFAMILEFRSYVCGGNFYLFGLENGFITTKDTLRQPQDKLRARRDCPDTPTKVDGHELSPG